MRKYHWSFFPLLFSFVMLMVSGKTDNQPKWDYLFNGHNLEGWDTYLGPEMDENGNQHKDQVPGLNTKNQDVFNAIELEGEQVLRVSGQHYGGISTVRDFQNFHLQLMFRWGEKVHGSKKGQKKDSGLLYFAVGPHGADYGYWMRSQEFQIEEGNCGDYWGCAGGSQEIPASPVNDSEYIFHPGAARLLFNEKSKQGRHCIKYPDAEKPTGEWNTVDLYCHGDTSIHVVNGKTVMVLYRSSQLENGKLKTLQKGKIQLQSEGAEIFYKEIKIRNLKRIPSALLSS